MYAKEEIEKFANKPTTVILFLHHFHLKNPLHIGKLKEMGVLAGAPQTIVKIDDESYNKIKSRGEIDGRFTIH